MLDQRTEPRRIGHVGCNVWSGVANLLNNDVLRKCLEPHAALLLYGDRNVTGLARIDVAHGAATSRSAQATGAGA